MASRSTICVLRTSKFKKTMCRRRLRHSSTSSCTARLEQLESNPIAESRQLAADARNRVFVLFLDLPHVSVEASRETAEPLIRLLDRLLGPDDLIGVMTPGMRPSDLVLSRKTEVLQSSLRDR